MQADAARVLDILLAADEIADCVQGLDFAGYQKSKLRAAVQWHVYVIGEAARQLSAEFKAQHPTIPWHKIIGARNILAHEYGRIDDAIMWKTATHSIPELAIYLKPFGPHEVEE
jgi:uncharacterized protein with HEPN domain